MTDTLNLDQQLLKDWKSAASLNIGDATRFLLNWTMFNHIYGCYWDSAPPGDDGGDKRQVIHASTWREVIDAFETIKRTHNAKSTLKLPLQNRRGQPVPAGLQPGVFNANQLSCEQYLLVAYEIRNSFVHGHRGLRKFDDQQRAAFSRGFVDFVTVLLGKLAPGVR